MNLRPLWPVAVLLGWLSYSAHALDWYRWRGPDLNGISKETGWQTSWPKEGPKQLWKASVGTGFSSMSVSGGRIFTMGNENETETVFCFDANTGEQRWKHSYPCPLDPHVYEGGPNATPTVDGGSDYTFSRKGHVFAFDATCGKVIWSKNVHDELKLKIPEWGLSGSVRRRLRARMTSSSCAGTVSPPRTRLAGFDEPPGRCSRPGLGARSGEKVY